MIDNVRYLKTHQIYTPPSDYPEQCDRVDCTINRFTLNHLRVEQDRSSSARIAAWCLGGAFCLTFWAVVIHAVWP